MTMSSRTAPAGSAGHDLVQQADAGNFDDLVLQAPGPVVVEFMSYSCAHCGAMEPVLQQVAQVLQSRQLFVRVNVALEVELAARYRIEGTPTIVLFQGGHEVGRIEGPLPSVPELLAAVTRPFGA
jgi:thioredoxin-like negative regulator of GroEL